MGETGKHGNHVRGSSHHRWNGHIVSDQGYVRIRVGRTHPLADPNGYAYEHTLVAVTALGRPLAVDEVVHHVNGDRQDNRWENLEVTTRSEHNLHHADERDRDAHGRFLPGVRR